ncbi:hypothetical protein EMPS_09956 [Entomortierella parvispora]|uniref:Stress-response A/B barrel domain-containing protein n=1 Tax=Entomortierella parvispora TaxID=205924 RepID=A0A9P3HJV5_9FUNG|nr:hypothetical protein EMPS_09956 [Entomortierella parvispora]
MAFIHIVLLKFNPTVSEDEAEEILRKLAHIKETLPGVIESVQLGINFNQRAKGFTHGFTMQFKDREALGRYLKAPEHVNIADRFVYPNTEDLLAFDYETAPFSSPTL